MAETSTATSHVSDTIFSNAQNDSFSVFVTYSSEPVALYSLPRQEEAPPHQEVIVVRGATNECERM